ncbi:hypothetical protein PanWU01x14_273000 [Parasponia andersonii]|uniref:Uncharacterized protein n=1 Tax=Parasponia andersonii TaxID=3476 RepID=A0A2P5B3Z3_PARAD|nr:hypothetical protein PanWU01x14_273000 [Parasponia andersonii]
MKACKLLDRKSLQLFKNLLDDAKLRLFKSAHSEIFKAYNDQSDVFNTQTTKLNPPQENILSGKDSNSHKNTIPRDDEERSIKPREVVSEFSKLSLSSMTAESQKNQLSQIMRDQHIKEKAKFPISKEKVEDQSVKGGEITRREKIDGEISNPGSRNNMVMSSVGCSPSFVSISTEKKCDIVETNYDFSKEVAKAIKQIDSHILALQLLKTSTTPVKSNETALFETLMGSKISGRVGKSTWGVNESLSQQTRKVYGSGQTPKAERTSGFSGQNVKAMDRFESPRPSQPASETNQRVSYVQGLRVPLSQDDQTVKKGMTGDTSRSVPFVMSQDHDQKLSRSMNRGSNVRREKKPPIQVIMRPTLLDQTDTQRRNKPRRKTVLSPAETSSSTHSSSSTGIESETGSYLVPSSTEDSESEQQSSSSYGRAGPSLTKTNVSRRRDSPEGIGRLRRIKNKLGFIFHHHHHHHHHHSNWKLLQKIFHSKKKRENYNHGRTEAAGNKLTRKSVVKSNTKRGSQDNVRQFHALVEGLLQHAGGHRLKKPEISKGGRNKKLVKKIHWWQWFQRHKGVKLPNRRGRVKVGFTSKTPKLKLRL